ncbi:hypothetical protein BDK51DRAFT_30653, partial [Blyttiomyces helicus]
MSRLSSAQVYIHRFGLSINSAIAISFGRPAGGDEQTRDQSIYILSAYFSAVSFMPALFLTAPFDFPHSSLTYFSSITLNPNIVNKAVTLLETGTIMGRPFQTYESHIPYLQQFLIDYNLYGMDYICLADARFRMPVLDIPRTPPLASSATSQPPPFYFKDETIDDRRKWPTDFNIRRQSYCELELDSWVMDITNRDKIKERKTKPLIDLVNGTEDLGEMKLVPSLEMIWEDERRRRVAWGLPSQLVNSTQSEDRLPYSEWSNEPRLRDQMLQALTRADDRSAAQPIPDATESQPSTMPTFEDDGTLTTFQAVADLHPWRGPATPREPHALSPTSSPASSAILFSQPGSLSQTSQGYSLRDVNPIVDEEAILALRDVAKSQGHSEAADILEWMGEEKQSQLEASPVGALRLSQQKGTPQGPREAGGPSQHDEEDSDDGEEDAGDLSVFYDEPAIFHPSPAKTEGARSPCSSQTTPVRSSKQRQFSGQSRQPFVLSGSSVKVKGKDQPSSPAISVSAILNTSPASRRTAPPTKPAAFTRNRGFSFTPTKSAIVLPSSSPGDPPSTPPSVMRTGSKRPLGIPSSKSYSERPARSSPSRLSTLPKNDDIVDEDAPARRTTVGPIAGSHSTMSVARHRVAGPASAVAPPHSAPTRDIEDIVMDEIEDIDEIQDDAPAPPAVDTARSDPTRIRPRVWRIPQYDGAADDESSPSGPIPLADGPSTLSAGKRPRVKERPTGRAPKRQKRHEDPRIKPLVFAAPYNRGPPSEDAKDEELEETSTDESSDIAAFITDEATSEIEVKGDAEKSDDELELTDSEPPTPPTRPRRLATRAVYSRSPSLGSDSLEYHNNTEPSTHLSERRRRLTGGPSARSPSPIGDSLEIYRKMRQTRLETRARISQSEPPRRIRGTFDGVVVPATRVRWRGASEGAAGFAGRERRRSILEESGGPAIFANAAIKKLTKINIERPTPARTRRRRPPLSPEVCIEVHPGRYRRRRVKEVQPAPVPASLPDAPPRADLSKPKSSAQKEKDRLRFALALLGADPAPTLPDPVHEKSHRQSVVIASSPSQDSALPPPDPVNFRKDFPFFETSPGREPETDGLSVAPSFPRETTPGSSQLTSLAERSASPPFIARITNVLSSPLSFTRAITAPSSPVVNPNNVRVGPIMGSSPTRPQPYSSPGMASGESLADVASDKDGVDTDEEMEWLEDTDWETRAIMEAQAEADALARAKNRSDSPDGEDARPPALEGHNMEVLIEEMEENADVKAPEETVELGVYDADDDSDQDPDRELDELLEADLDFEELEPSENAGGDEAQVEDTGDVDIDAGQAQAASLGSAALPSSAAAIPVHSEMIDQLPDSSIGTPASRRTTSLLSTGPPPTPVALSSHPRPARSSPSNPLPTTFRFPLPPPTTSDLLSTLTLYDVPEVIYKDAHYSLPADVPARPKVFAGREFRFQKAEPTSLKPFDTSGCVVRGAWDESGRAAFEGTQGARLVRGLDYWRNAAGTRGESPSTTSIKQWTLATTPPSHAMIKRWLEVNPSKHQPDEHKATTEKGKDIESDPAPVVKEPPLRSKADVSQIEGPTLANPHGFKFSQGRSTPVAHDKNYMCILSLEIHGEKGGKRGEGAASRGDMVPNPLSDPVLCVVYCLQNEDDARYRSNGHKQGYVATLWGRVRGPGGLVRYIVDIVPDEKALIETVVEKVRSLDPDILIGYEIHTASWGYLVERAGEQHGIDLMSELSRVVTDKQATGRFSREGDQWGYKKQSALHATGRIFFNVWRLMRSEVNLTSYTLENMAFHILHQRIPKFPYKVLTQWYDHGMLMRWRTLKYYIDRVQYNIELLDSTEIIGRTSEHARVFGIDFYSVVSRGSQFKVESVMSRIARPENFIMLSPSRKQVSNQRAIECLPLVMEPQSRFYNNPLAVLDFQSLYPSVMIAYNYCYSTCLGRVEGFATPHKVGVLDDFEVPLETLKLLKDHVNVSPNGVVFVKPHIREGVIRRMLTEILDTRVMIKQSMKKYKSDKASSRPHAPLYYQALMKVLDARQLALKFIANVTYGYTGASFSGRMPCMDIADAIVQTGRATLEKSRYLPTLFPAELNSSLVLFHQGIRLIAENESWGAEVVYGDTDSLFVHIPGISKARAFKIGRDITNAISRRNIQPVYLPSILLTKKRYVGFAWEAEEDLKPSFDAKGIETVRRDNCPVVGKTMETCIKILFRTQDLSQVKEYLQRQWTKILAGRVSIDDFIIAKEVKLGTYRQVGRTCPIFIIHTEDTHRRVPPYCSARGPPPPGALISSKRMEQDERAEPQYGERVPYVVVHSGSARLIDSVVSPDELLNNRTLRLHDLATWFAEIPRVHKAIQFSSSQLPAAGGREHG